jgi:hypothetical protein
MDGRVQLPVIRWIMDNYNVDYVDAITEAGIDGLIADESNNIDSIIEKINISIDKHGSEIVFVVGHHDCAGNSVSETEHKEHIILSVDRLKRLISTDVYGLWVSDKWIVEKI